MRLAAFTSFYVAQGLPVGLLTIALPAWFAGKGLAAGDIAGFVAVTSLPWAFKLFAGPLMDRFSYPIMGRRRPWVLAAQSGLLLSLLGLIFAPDAFTDLPLFTAACFLVNLFAAVQDVAVDGMAIDVLPTDERGRANAFMAGGQVLGISVSSALSARALGAFGVPGAAIALGIGILLVLLVVLLIREREGEALLPWSQGRVAPELAAGAQPRFARLVADLLRVLFLPTSLVLLTMTLCYRTTDGILVAALPSIVVKQLGWADTVYADWMAIANAVAAGFGLIAGVFIDRWGSHRVLQAGLPVLGIAYLGIGLAVDAWTLWYFPLIALFVIQLLVQVMFVSLIAVHMEICWQKVAATQFAIYMAWANFCRSTGAGFYRTIAELVPPGGEFMIMGVLCLAGSVVMRFLLMQRHRERLAALGG